MAIFGKKKHYKYIFYPVTPKVLQPELVIPMLHFDSYPSPTMGQLSIAVQLL